MLKATTMLGFFLILGRNLNLGVPLKLEVATTMELNHISIILIK